MSKLTSAIGGEVIYDRFKIYRFAFFIYVFVLASNFLDLVVSFVILEMVFSGTRIEKRVSSVVATV
jgi:hypothetical protein